MEKGRRLVFKEEKICDFEVELKITTDLPAVDSFSDKMRLYLDSLTYCQGDGVHISQLLDSDTRVTFIRGNAGMGKSVLAKKLALNWANGKLYSEDINLCIMIECKEITKFAMKMNMENESPEKFCEFVKTKFNFNLEDGDKVLFVIDGLSELSDVWTND